MIIVSRHLLLIAACSLGSWLTSADISTTAQGILWKQDDLVSISNQVRAQNPVLLPFVAALRNAAFASDVKPWSDGATDAQVNEKLAKVYRTKTASISTAGSPRNLPVAFNGSLQDGDYLSIMDPTCIGIPGSPYRGSKADVIYQDKDQFDAMVKRVNVFTQYWWVAKDAGWLRASDGGARKFARWAGLQLKAWFINPATRMNPNCDHGQCDAIQGPTGTQWGVIELCSLGSLVDSIRLLEQSQDSGLNENEKRILHTWFYDYLKWNMEENGKGQLERYFANNHSTHWYLQCLPIALYLDSIPRATINGYDATVLDVGNVARALLRDVPRKVINRQIFDLDNTDLQSDAYGNFDKYQQIATIVQDHPKWARESNGHSFVGATPLEQARSNSQHPENSSKYTNWNLESMATLLRIYQIHAPGD